MPKKPNIKDKFALYEAAVQEPSADCDFIDRAYRAANKRRPARLREDFCATAAVCCEWARRRPGNFAVGVDLDPKPLAWAVKHHLSKLSGEERSRVSLVKANVLDAGKAGGGFDVVAALNFSYWVFRQRADMLRYFTGVREALAPGGVFVCDFFGGSDVMREMEERSRKRGFTYIWDQHSYDPLTGDYTCHIHFELPGGRRMQRAFTYHWRLWTIPELLDVLREAGFGTVKTYIEREDSRGRGTGFYYASKRADADRCFLAYLVAGR